MLFIYLAVLLVFLLLFFSSRKETLRGIDAPHGPIRPFYRMAVRLYRMRTVRRLFSSPGIKRELTALGHPGKPEKVMESYCAAKIALALAAVLAGDTAAVCLYAAGRNADSVVEETYIERNTYGQGEREITLNARGRNEEDYGSYPLTVEELRYGEEEIRAMFDEASALLPNCILRDNPGPDQVYSQLWLPDKMEGYPFSISWRSGDYSLIDETGKVWGDKVRKEGEVVNLTAEYAYTGYRFEQNLYVRVCPPPRSEEERLREEIASLLLEAERASPSEAKVKLPGRAGGVRLLWRERTEDDSPAFFLLACLSGVLILGLKDRELHARMEKRNRELERAYPGMVSRLTLYLGAGMTVNGAFHRMAESYVERQGKGGEKQYAEEEILLFCRETDSGIADAEALRRLAGRCRVKQYTRLAALLTQNLSKGSSQLFDLLKEEAAAAFEERKELARKAGEEAGTKLLFPMMLMLGIVMVLIVVPAYLSFSV